MNNLKQDIQELQNGIIKALQQASRLIMTSSISETSLNDMMDDFLCSLEASCVDARRMVERYRPIVPIGEMGKKPRTILEVTGSAEVTPEGWVHITLNTLLPHVKFKTSPYLQDTITQLLDGCPYNLPKFDHVFLAIVECCNHENRNAFDQDNKGWKVIPNALKGRLFEDDDQFHMSIGLFSELSDKAECHIYVLPREDFADFAFDLMDDLI